MSTDEKEPISDERAREVYTLATSWHGMPDDQVSEAIQHVRASLGREWDAWQAAHDVRVAVEARKAGVAAIRARLAEQDVPIHIAADLEQILVEDLGAEWADNVLPREQTEWAHSPRMRQALVVAASVLGERAKTAPAEHPIREDARLLRNLRLQREQRDPRRLGSR